MEYIEKVVAIVVISVYFIASVAKYVYDFFAKKRLKDTVKSASELISTKEGEAEEAKEQARLAEAHSELMDKLDGLICQAEKTYPAIGGVLKQGATKLDSVITKMQMYALQKGYDFDMEYWKKVIDDKVNYINDFNKKKKE